VADDAGPFKLKVWRPEPVVIDRYDQMPRSPIDGHIAGPYPLRLCRLHPCSPNPSVGPISAGHRPKISHTAYQREDFDYVDLTAPIA
jgi:hypothetical protein